MSGRFSIGYDTVRSGVMLGETPTRVRVPSLSGEVQQGGRRMGARALPMSWLSIAQKKDGKIKGYAIGITRESLNNFKQS